MSTAERRLDEELLETHRTWQPHPTDASSEPRLRRWTCTEFHRLGELGILGPEERVELLDGEIYLRGTDGETRRWTCDEYERLGAMGVIRPDERVELIDGEVVEMSPQRSPHATAVTLASQVLFRLLGERLLVRVQLPLRLYGNVAPEPDIAVVSGTARDYAARHPETALLVWEVSDTTLTYDQGAKASLYASAGIAEYWITDLVNGRLEVRRDPARLPGEAYGYGYSSIRYLGASGVVSCLAAPAERIAVSDILP